MYFHLFKQTLQFLQQINGKNVHPVNGAGIRTHNLRNMSLLTSGQSYKQFTLVNYDSRVVPDLKTLHITTLGL